MLGERLNNYRSGTYGLPGGRLELDEALETAAKRELIEETGVDAKHLSYLGVIRELQDGYNFIHFVYSCDSFVGEPKTMEPEKCAGWNWYHLNGLPEKILPGHWWAIDMMKKKGSQVRDIL